MDTQVEEAVRVLHSSLSRMRWRLRPQAKRRLVLDVAALCTRLRPVVMVDYGGKIPELQEQLCGLLCFAHKESTMLFSLRVMVIEEMVYLFHVEAMLEHIRLSLSSEFQLQFAVLDQGPPKLVLLEEENAVVHQFISIQKQFLSIMSSYAANMMGTMSDSHHHPNISDEDSKPFGICTRRIDPLKTNPQKGSKLNSTFGLLDNDSSVSFKFSMLIDLSQCVRGTQVALPTLNGWLLGYPIVYFFDKEHVTQAVHTLSTGCLRLFRILICSEVILGKEAPREEELMSFSVLAELSDLGEDELWAKMWFMRMIEKMERCKEVWKHIKLEVIKCTPQSIAL